MIPSRGRKWPTSSSRIEPIVPVEEVEFDDSPRVDATQLVDASRAMARASPDRFAEAQDFAERPRRKFISANTREHLYAGYMRSWVAKVERVGNMNYPEQARRHNLAGSLVLSVDVLHDGSVEQIRVLRSSGYDVLDEAAVRIVRLSSPFSPLARGDSGGGRRVDHYPDLAILFGRTPARLESLILLSADRGSVSHSYWAMDDLMKFQAPKLENP
jgi:TonB family protein